MPHPRCAHLPAAAPQEAVSPARMVAIPRACLRYPICLAQTEQGLPGAILIPLQSEPPAAGSRNRLFHLPFAPQPG